MKCVLEYLEKSTKAYPQKIAVIENDRTLTYEELSNLSKIVASSIIELSLTRKPIGIFMEKGINSLVSFFASLYSGCFYSLINPDLPDSRINSIYESLNPSVIITTQDLKDKASILFKKTKILVFEDILNKEINENEINMRLSKQIDTDPVYCNFTSGSTGNPKGVIVSSRSIIDFIDEFTSLFNINKSDVIANQAPFDFDVSVKDIYSSIKVGATLLIVPKPLFSNPSKLLDYLVENKATTLIWAVSALCLITTFHGLDYKVPERVNKVIFSGEVMPKKHLDIWMQHLKKAKFINVYGPTEITCNCTYHIIDRKRTYEEIPIGVPFKNERVFLLDSNNEEITNDGVVGEICVTGSCLSLGYINNEIENERHFEQNPLNRNYRELIYRTGDLAKIINNELYFQGRKDFQIKYMGHRIELEEIDNAINKLDGVIRSITIFSEEKNRLYSFYIGILDEVTIRESLKSVLPSYMISSKYIKIDEFPLTKNGKVDRAYLMSKALGGKV